MKRRRIGHTDVTVTELGFGAAPIGNLYAALDDLIATSTVQAAWQAGIRYFDTAPHYGLGLAERRLGNALANHPRDDYVISTKLGRLLVPNPAPTGSDLTTGGFDVPDDLTRTRDYSRDGMYRGLEASLARLGLDRVDIALVHDPEDHLLQAIDEAIPALVDLRDQGVVRAIGAGMNYWQPLQRIVDQTDVDVVMIAGRWTLIDRSAEPLLETCLNRNVSVLAAAPFNSGLLAAAWPADDANFNYRTAAPEMLLRARAYARTCRKHLATLPQAALQFPLRHPAVAATVTGTRSPAEVAMNVSNFQQELSGLLWHDLATLSLPDGV